MNINSNEYNINLVSKSEKRPTKYGHVFDINKRDEKERWMVWGGSWPLIFGSVLETSMSMAELKVVKFE